MANEGGIKRDARGRFVKGSISTATLLPQELRDAFRAKSPAALRVLYERMTDETEDSKVRIRCAEIILDRGYGKPSMAVEMYTPAGDDETGLVFLPEVRKK